MPSLAAQVVARLKREQVEDQDRQFLPQSCTAQDQRCVCLPFLAPASPVPSDPRPGGLDRISRFPGLPELTERTACILSQLDHR